MRCSSAPTSLQTQQTNAIKFPFTVYIGWSNIGCCKAFDFYQIFKAIPSFGLICIFVSTIIYILESTRMSHDISGCMISQVVWYPSSYCMMSQVLLYHIPLSSYCMISMHVCVYNTGIFYDIPHLCMFV